MSHFGTSSFIRMKVNNNKSFLVIFLLLNRNTVMKVFLKLLIILAFILKGASIYAQKSDSKPAHPYISNQFSINLSILRTFENSTSHHLMNSTLCPSLGIHYGLNDWLEVGASSTLRKMNFSNKTVFFQCYTAEAKTHLLPAIINPSFYIVDVYATAQIGLSHYPNGGIEAIQPVTKFCWGGNAGLAFNPSRHFGFFGEYGYINAEHFKQYLRFGLNIRFGGPKKWQNSKQ